MPNLLLPLFLLYGLIFGALFGSFVTALVYRQKHKLSMWERHSICPSCKKHLTPRDLLPVVSYMLLGGRCRHCGARINRSYVLIELTSVLVFLTLAFFLYAQMDRWWPIEGWWLGAVAIFLSAMAVLLLAMAVYDVFWKELPNAWTLGGSVVGLAAITASDLLDMPVIWQPAVQGLESSMINSLVAGVVAALGFMTIGWLAEKMLKKPSMGMGDAKLALLMGILLGFPGVVVALYIAFISGAMVSLLLIAGRRASLGATLPFGPFLVLGTWMALLFAEPVITWYRAFLP